MYQVIPTKFWWAVRKEGDGIHWVAWEDMHKSKHMEGLVFCIFNDFNRAVIAKHVWKIFIQPHG